VPLHSGLASRAGLEAVQLARAGLDASATLLEGNAGPGLLTFLGAPAGALADINPADWRGETLDQVYLKPFPGCRHVHPAVEAALGLRARLADNTLACRRIEVSTYDLAVSFGAMPRPQAELYDCLMSLPWCVASALLSGAPDAQTVSTGRDSPELWSLSKRVVVRHDASHQQHYPGRLGATLVVVDDRGVRHEQQAVLYYADSAQTYSPAGPFGPVLDEAGVIAKFLRLTCATLTPSRQQALIEGILEAQPSHECRATTGASTR
jgi:2-methylcitrate dehydratase PrpD